MVVISRLVAVAQRMRLAMEAGPCPVKEAQHQAAQGLLAVEGAGGRQPLVGQGVGVLAALEAALRR